MGSSKKKKNEAFSITLANSHNDLSISDVKCSSCLFSDIHSSAYFIVPGSTGPEAMKCASCAVQNAPLSLGTIHLNPKTGLFVFGSENFYDMSIATYLETISATKCLECGQFQEASGFGHNCESIQPYDSANAVKTKIASNKAKLLSLGLGGDGSTWTEKTHENSIGIPLLGYISISSEDGTPITINALQNGMWTWSESSNPNAHPEVFSEPEYALNQANLVHSPAIKNVKALSNPTPYELPGESEKTGNFKVKFGDDPDAYVSVYIEKYPSGMYTYIIAAKPTALDSGTIMTGMAKNYSNVKAIIDMNLEKGLGRCELCGQFLSLASAGSHTCPTINVVPKKKVTKKKITTPDTTTSPGSTPQVVVLGAGDATVSVSSDANGDTTPDTETDSVATDNVTADDVTEDAVETEVVVTGDAVVDLAMEQVAGSNLSGQGALDYQLAHGEDVLTPIPVPGELKAGDGIGQHLVLGGSDFYDSAVTIISYKDSINPDSGVRQVVFTEITPDAEAKMLESMSSETKMMETTTEVTEVGRHPSDVENNLYADIKTASISVNHHLKEQDEIPENTLTKISNLEDTISKLKSDYEGDEEVQKMLSAYELPLENLKTWRDKWSEKKTEYMSDAMIMPKTFEYSAMHTFIKKEMVPMPGGDGLAVTIEKVASISPTLMPNGESHWDGSVNGLLGDGSQYKIELGDGYTAYYRPHNGDHLAYGAPSKGARGQLEIVGPNGVDDPEKLVRALGRMHLPYQPLRQKEAEWSYLNANIFSQDLGSRMDVKTARASGEMMISARAEQISAARMDEMLDLDEVGMDEWSTGVRIQAEKESLMDRAAILRNAVAKVSGFTNSAEMLKSSNYSPSPRITRAGVKWQRFDVTSEAIDQTWGERKRGLSHSISGSSDRILDVLATGSLSSQSRRRRIGVVTNTGMSENQDINTGGSRSIFLRNSPASFLLNSPANQKYSPAGLVWEKPGAVLSRTDWHANTGDKYGAISKNRNPLKIVNFNDNSNEIMISDGIDIYGSEAPTRVHVPKNLRDKALAIVAAKGITSVNGIPVEDWIV